MGIKYKEIADILEEDILKGKYIEGSKLPTIEELMKKFDVSKNTMRSAIELLVIKGYIYQVQGSGIFIRPTVREGSINITNMRGLSKELNTPDVRSEILKFEVVKANKELAKKFRCNLDTELYYVERLRIVKEEPFSIEYSYFNKEIITYLNREIIENSIYEYITEGLKYNIGFADKIICCEKLTKKEVELLELKNGDMALSVENTVYLTNGLIFDVSKSKYNSNKTKFISVANYR